MISVLFDFKLTLFITADFTFFRRQHYHLPLDSVYIIIRFCCDQTNYQFTIYSLYDTRGFWLSSGFGMNQEGQERVWSVIWGCGYPCVIVLAVERWCYNTCFVLVSYFKGAPIPPCLAQPAQSHINCLPALLSLFIYHVICIYILNLGPK